jgi:hypothetical protein
LRFSLVAGARAAVSLSVLTLTLSACNSSTSSTTPATLPGNAYPTTTKIAVPNVPNASWFDISWVDPAASQYYLADRANAGVTVINTKTKTYVSTAGSKQFTGQSIGGAANTGGPNGILSIGGGIVFAGDGNSTLKVVNVNTGAVLASIPTVNPCTTNPCQGVSLTPLAGNQCGTPATPTSGTANLRADELAYDPADNIILIINDVSCPAFGTFVSAAAPYTVLGSIAFLTATAGAEQPTWDPTQKKFLMALPATIANPGGEIDVIDPKTFSTTGVFAQPNMCNGNGTALGKSENLFVGCTVGPLVIMNATNGATIASFPPYTGCDQVWFNPVANRFYAACSNFPTAANPYSPVAVVIDATFNSLVTVIATGTGAHSIAVDSTDDTIYIPLRGSGVSTFGH